MTFELKLKDWNDFLTFKISWNPGDKETEMKGMKMEWMPSRYEGMEVWTFFGVHISFPRDVPIVAYLRYFIKYLYFGFSHVPPSYPCGIVVQTLNFNVKCFVFKTRSATSIWPLTSELEKCSLSDWYSAVVGWRLSSKICRTPTPLIVDNLSSKSTT